MTTRSTVFSLAIVAAASLLLVAVPLVAMHFTPEVDWSVGDFVAGGILLFVAGVAIVSGLRLTSSTYRRVGVVVTVLLLLALVWTQLAVGLYS